ncbi:hypothetical protein ACTHGU_17070 [Chitinophagaceae bacterium MMS25-I14]
MYNTEDYQQREKISYVQFLLRSYGLSLLVGGAVAGLLYALSVHFNLNPIDRGFSFMFGFIVATILWGRINMQWTKFPDGNYYRIKIKTDGIALIRGPEPLFYDKEYYYSKPQKIFNLLLGLGVIGGGIWFVTMEMYVYPVFLFAMGAFLAYSSVKELADKMPRLKLSGEGLWTKKLGFRSWKSVSRTEIKVEKGSKSESTYLEIYLWDTDDPGEDYLEEKLLISDLARYKNIEDDLNLYRKVPA